MELSDVIYVAGHQGLAGSAIVRALRAGGYRKLVLRSHAQLDLENHPAVLDLFASEHPMYVFMAAARVGGIVANASYPVDFLMSNLAIESNVIRAAHAHRVKRLVFLGSSCIYPRDCAQPMREGDLLGGPLEPTNRAYAVAKIAGIEMCRAYNRQHGTTFLAAMPTNLYGPGDNYHLEHSHVLPALLRKVHEAHASGADTVTIWGSGQPQREFLHADDLAEALVFLMNLDGVHFHQLLDHEAGPLINVGSGLELSIEALAHKIARVVGYAGQFIHDTSRPDGTPRKLMDNTRLGALGWTPRIPFDEGLNQTYADFLAALP